MPVVGNKTNPIGSVAELKAAGLDPALYPSCAQRDPAKNILGCECWDSCRFDDARMGSFKGTRPHYVGYTLTPDNAEASEGKEDSCRCFDFVRVIQDRMDTGRELRFRKQDGELIEVIAQEGEHIYRNLEVGLNSRGQIIKPMQQYVAILEATINPDSGKPFAVNLDDKSDPVGYRTINVELEVPKFPLISQRGAHSYAAKVAERQRQRDAARQKAEVQAWKDVREEMRVKPAGAVRPALADEADEADEPVAVPNLDALMAKEPKKRGRPTNAERAAREAVGTEAESEA